MNFHGFVTLVEFFAVCGIAMLTMLYLALPARAHPFSGRTSFSPSVFAGAERLAREGRSQDAIAAYEAIRTSVSYRDTAYAPEAVYRTAHLYRDDLHNPQEAMSQYEALLFEYPRAAYPHQSFVRAERADLGRVLDRRNSRQFLYKIIAFFVRLAGSSSRSYPDALFLLSLATRIFLLPLTLRQQKEAQRTARLRPQIEAMQANKDDQVKTNAQIMALYKKEGVHPFLSIALALAQGAVFFVVYQAILLYKYHLIGGTFLWIQGAAALAHPVTVAYDLSEPDLALLLCYGAITVASQRLMVASQAGQTSQMAMSSIVTTVLIIAWTWTNHSPSGFVLYWLISSLLGMLTQFVAQRMMPLPAAH